MTIRSNRTEFSARQLAVGYGYLRPSSGLRIAPLLATLLLATAIFSFAARPSAAAQIYDGSFVFAGSVGDPTPSVANPTSSVVTTETNTVTTDTFVANVTSTVYENSSTNPFSIYDGGSVNDAMTFVYQITVTGPPGAEVDRLNVSDFGSNQTDVGYNIQTLSNILPTFLGRSLANGVDTVSFSFNDGSAPYGAVKVGDTTALLVINTDSTSYSNTYAFLQDGSNGITPSYAVYAPMFATPEPASVVLMVLGLAGLLAASRACRANRLASDGASIGLTS